MIFNKDTAAPVTRPEASLSLILKKTFISEAFKWFGFSTRFFPLFQEQTDHHAWAPGDVAAGRLGPVQGGALGTWSTGDRVPLV